MFAVTGLPIHSLLVLLQLVSDALTFRQAISQLATLKAALVLRLVQQHGV
jgi:hypothetical protein